MIIGSWCIPFYKNYFSKPTFTTPIRTRDIDFLVPAPKKIRKNISVPELLKDLGFIVSFKGSEGYIQLQHPFLMIEFLVPEKGKGIDKPYPLPKLGLNAQTLRFLDLLGIKTIKTELEGIQIVLPHPAAFALHKLLTAQRRKNPEKAEKDKRDAILVMGNLVENSEQAVLRNIFEKLHAKWQKLIIKSLEQEKETELLALLKP
ncbi:MAG: hypothetical protein JW803_01595 [Endomicrobiales bacterium]|nr:hypothetical protein [Endomicrobiales bacterium]